MVSSRSLRALLGALLGILLVVTIKAIGVWTLVALAAGFIGGLIGWLWGE